MTPIKSNLFLSHSPNLTQLPHELIGYVVSFLNMEETQTFSTLCKSLNYDTVNQAKALHTRNIFVFLENSKNILLHTSYKERVDDLNFIQSKLDFGCENLGSLKDEIFKIKDLILSVFSSLDIYAITELQSVEPPVFFSNIFTLSKIYRNFKTIKHSAFLFSKDQMISNLVEGLRRENELSRALEMNTYIVSYDLKDWSFLHITDAYIDRNNISKALSIANMIKDPWRKSLAIQHISDKVIQNGDLEEGLEIAKNISFQEVKESFYWQLSKRYLDQGNVFQAYKVILQFLDPVTSDAVLTRVATDLIDAGNLFTAIEFAKKISDIQQFNQIVANICTSLINIQDFTSAENLLQYIHDEGLKAEILYNITLNKIINIF